MSTSGGATWKTLSDDMGDGYAVAIDGQTIYQAGCATDEASRVQKMAVFSSADQGRTWTKSLFHDRTSVVKAIAVRQGRKTILFAGGHESISSRPRSLLYKSINGGVTWSEVPVLMGVSTSINAICIDPGNSDRVVVATDNGVWVSDDLGLTWMKSEPNFLVSCLVANPKKAGRFYAGSKEGVWESNDRGKTWREVGGRILGQTVTRLEIDGKNSILYAGTNHGGVLRLRLKALVK